MGKTKKYRWGQCDFTYLAKRCPGIRCKKEGWNDGLVNIRCKKHRRCKKRCDDEAGGHDPDWRYRKEAEIFFKHKDKLIKKNFLPQTSKVLELAPSRAFRLVHPNT